MTDNYVRFVDTTFRDGAQSLWAMNMPGGMMTAVAEDLDRAGLAVIEVPANAINFKKIIRDLKEDPWVLMAELGRLIPNTPKSCMGGGFGLASFGGTPTPPELGKLFWETHHRLGSLQRVQVTANTRDQTKKMIPGIMPFFRGLGMQVACALAYAVTPRHTDEAYAAKVREVAAFKPDVIYIKDQGGLLTVDRIRTLAPVFLANAGGIPVELHSHCTTGLAPLVYMEALKLGIRTLHTGVPPLAEGPAQPSVLTTASNARRLGFDTGLDEERLRSVSERLTGFAVQDGKVLGAPLAYDAYQYDHQIPGGVISNLGFQLGELGLANRLDQVIAESVVVQRELGYPIMITPYSQYVATQAMMNVVTGERYKAVGDEIIRLAQGVYGEDSGYEFMDQNLKDRLLAMPRAKELAELDKRGQAAMSMKELRETLGGPGVSDEELMMRAIMAGPREVDVMHAAGPPRRYGDAAVSPVISLLEELNKHSGVRSIHISRGGDSISLQRRAVN